MSNKSAARPPAFERRRAQSVELNPFTIYDSRLLADSCWLFAVHFHLPFPIYEEHPPANAGGTDNTTGTAGALARILKAAARSASSQIHSRFTIHDLLQLADLRPLPTAFCLPTSDLRLLLPTPARGRQHRRTSCPPSNRDKCLQHSSSQPAHRDHIRQRCNTSKRGFDCL